MIMTEQQREVYMLLCMTGRNGEAEQYRLKCEVVGGNETELSVNEEDIDAG